jgi:hypothetical protein
VFLKNEVIQDVIGDLPRAFFAMPGHLNVMALFGFVACVAVGVDSQDSQTADPSIKIGLLLPITGPWKAGRSIPGAAALAVQRINADPSFLGGMRIEYVYVDAGFTVSSGSDAMSKLLGIKGIDAVFGPGEPTVLWLCFASLYSTVVGRPIDVHRMVCSTGRGLSVDGTAQHLVSASPGRHNCLMVRRGW